MSGHPLRAPLTHPHAGASSTPGLGKQIVIGAVALLVVIRLFTEVVPVLPAALKLVDVPLVALMVVAVAVQPTTLENRRASSGFLLVLSVVFLAVVVASVLVNLSRVSTGPVLLFLYGFLAPLVAYGAAYRLWPAGHALSFSRLLVALGTLQLVVVAAIDLPRFLSTGNPDEISGTFGENPYQLVFFLIVFCALLAGIVMAEPRRRAARAAPLLVLGALAAVFLAQYRALLVAAAVAIVLLAWLLATAPRAGRARGLLFGIFAVAAFVGVLGFVAVRFPTTKYEPYLAEVQQSPFSFVQVRVEALGGALDMFDAQPETVPVGSGPGTFSSRAWETFSNAKNVKRAPNDPVGRGIDLLTGGARYSTDVSDRYSAPRQRNQEVILGSRALSSPFSSYTSLLAEVGVLGLLVMAAIYAAALGQAIGAARSAMRIEHAGSVVGLALAAVVAFALLLQMAVLGNWLEVTRLTMLSWMLLAVVAKELDARHEVP